MKQLLIPILLVGLSVYADVPKLSPFPTCNLGDVKVVEMYKNPGGYFIDDKNSAILETNIDILTDCIIKWGTWADQNKQ